MRRLFLLWRLSARDLRVVWAALRHPHRPPWLLPASLALVLFALDPFNVAIPALGVIDDLVLLPLLLRVLAACAAAWSGPAPTDRDPRVVSVQ